ncbi:NF038130 family PEP-CTERM protein [Nostoc sp. LEGE 06077]|uniref:NF038130 family PEP-CTERM protein n=1 Tax=Nostoc sp. LEGE 06077 TaxID=915325 RepID=UPI001882AC6D|nr:NF038130 family PEP-CTERM protein [Nostoc sp. LEGE 06077]MBE9207384.1 NF038130 family PEP-CTERM protein [Nostoc sp. LEGE 06077]
MKRTFQTLVIGASMAVGVSAIASNPAQAYAPPASPANPVGITDATVEGTAPYITYGVSGGNTVKVDNTTVNVQTALQGNSTSPGGNIELFSNSEALNLIQFLNYDQATSISGTIAGKNITLSSLTAKDWFGDSVTSISTALSSLPSTSDPVAYTQALMSAISPLYNSSNLATQWFNTALSTYNVAGTQDMFNAFLVAGGFQRFSDPNLSYVNQDKDGTIRIGLAGHEDAKTLIQQKLAGDLSQAQTALGKVQTALTDAQTAYNILDQAQNGLTAYKQKYPNTTNITTTALGIERQTLKSQNKSTSDIDALLGFMQKGSISTISYTQLSSKVDTAKNTAKSGVDSLTTQKDAVISKINLINDGLAKLPETIQASELVKVAYNGGPAQYLYSFNATGSGVVAQDDGISHNGNYEVTIQGVPVKTPEPTSVPEPSVVLGMLGVAGIVAIQRKSKKVSG